MREALLFSGIRWGGAKVVDRTQVACVQFPAYPDEKKVLFEYTLIIETTGQGRPYSVTFAEGWWRDFAELPLDDEKRVLSFLQRRGDPFGVLVPGGKQISTADWRILKATLRCATLAWDPQPDETGVSRFRPEKLRSAEHMFEFSDGWARELDVYYSGVTPMLRPRVLAAYLCAAAASSVRAGVPMRRCDYCHSWFNLHYAAARQCSASCRAARFNGRTSPHGFVSQDHDTHGSDPVADPVAGARNERPPARSLAELRHAEGSEGPRLTDARNRKSRRRRPTST
jgi:hypothetical protein